MKQRPCVAILELLERTKCLPYVVLRCHYQGIMQEPALVSKCRAALFSSQTHRQTTRDLFRGGIPLRLLFGYERNAVE
jgi:hypothetical protein